MLNGLHQVLIEADISGPAPIISLSVAGQSDETSRGKLRVRANARATAYPSISGIPSPGSLRWVRIRGRC